MFLSKMLFARELAALVLHPEIDGSKAPREKPKATFESFREKQQHKITSNKQNKHMHHAQNLQKVKLLQNLRFGAEADCLKTSSLSLLIGVLRCFGVGGLANIANALLSSQDIPLRKHLL